MSQAATAFVEFEGDFTKIGRGAGGQAKQLEGTFNSSFKRIAAFASAAIAGIGVGEFLKSAFSAAEDSQKVNRLTAAVIKSTGGAAHVTAQQVDELAGSMAGVDGIDDDVIRSAENVLLTFRDVRNEAGKGNDIFDQGITAATNLSAALGTDLQGSVIQVGKALNDPIKGMTALRRVGVSFTAQQVDQVKALVASGHQLDAQKLILGELTKEFGGAAAAAATPAAKLKASFRQIEESVGGLLIPIFSKFASFIVTTVDPAIVRLIPFLEGLGKIAFAALQLGFGGNSVDQLHGWIKVVAQIGGVAREAADFVLSAWDDLLGGFQNPNAKIGKSVDGVEAIFLRLGAAIRKIVDFVQRNWKPILAVAAAALLVFTAPLVAVVGGLVALYLRFNIVREAVARFAAFWVRNWPTIQAVAKKAFDVVLAAGKLLIPALVNLGRGLAALIGWFRKNADVAAALAAPIAALVLGFAALKVIASVQKLFEAIRVSVLAFNAVLAANPIVLIIAGLVALGAAVFLAYKHFKPFHDAVDAAWQILQSLFHWVQQNWPLLVAILTGPIGLATLFVVKHFDQIRSFISGVFTWVRDHWPLLVAILTGPFGLAVLEISRHFDQIVGFFTALPGRITGTVKRIAAAALGVGSAILNAIVRGLEGAVGFVTDIGRDIANAAIGFVNKIIDGINAALDIKIHIPGGGHFGIPKNISINPPDIPHIPTLDTGAVVTDPTFALLAAGAKGQPEIVTPEQLMRQVFSDVLAAKKSQQQVLDARTIVEGNVYGDAHLQSIFDAHDRKLEHTLAAGARA